MPVKWYSSFRSMYYILIMDCILSIESSNYIKYNEYNSGNFHNLLMVGGKINNTKDTLMSLNGTSIISPMGNSSLEYSSNSSVKNFKKQKYLGLENADVLTQTQLINRLTAPSRYDRLERPPVSVADGKKTPLEVFVRAYIYVMQSIDSTSLQLKIHGLLQLRYMDSRLAFDRYAPSRKQPILGEEQLRQLIWVPHIFLANEHDSSILGINEKDILTSISANGTIVISTRIMSTLFCWMDLTKFPFDEQYCSTLLESWVYNSSDLVLHWEKELPLTFDPELHLTEYSFKNAWCKDSYKISNENDMRHGAFIGNYSSLNFTIYLIRESGYYIMDYFLPSIMIVAISWVSFWLQADQTPARTTLGTSTMLSFITLASSQDHNLPKVSYIKISEVWFLGCTLFIFSSLVEFAFVNAIWRRNQKVELKKVNSKHILKSTLTPRDMNFRKLSKTTSTTIHSLEIVTEDRNGTDNRQTWGTMTSEEVSLWIDRKSRLVFPVAFLIFNIVFWILVYFL